MGDPKTQEWWQGIGKALLYVVFILIGVVVSVAMEVEQVIMSKKKVIIRVLFSVCAGAIASFACVGFKLNNGISAVIVPCSTIIGQEFFKWLNGGGWRIFINYITRSGKKKEE